MPVISFFVVFFSGFGIRVMLPSEVEFRSNSSYSMFWKSLKRLSVNSSLNIWKHSPMNSGPGLLYGGRFLKMTHLLVGSYFPFLPGVVMGECMFLGIYSDFSRLPT